MNRLHTLAALAAATALLAACGGGDDPAAATNANNAGNNAGAALTCNTNGYVAGSVELPTSAQLAAYAATYNGDEGAYGRNIGDPFVKSASVTMVLAADGTVTYKGQTYTPSSVCVDKVAGNFGKILYVVAGNGHLDISDTVDATLGNAWGVSPADGSTVFTKGLK